MAKALNPRKVSTGMSIFFSAIISISVILLVILAVVYGIPYLYNRSTAHRRKRSQP